MTPSQSHESQSHESQSHTSSTVKAQNIELLCSPSSTGYPAALLLSLVAGTAPHGGESQSTERPIRHMIEAPWLVNGGHGASLRRHKGTAPDSQSQPRRPRVRRRSRGNIGHPPSTPAQSSSTQPRFLR
eukprot:COSAG01_NODE_2760_length_7120_cov_49.854253_4_plen_129_part_00